MNSRFFDHPDLRVSGLAEARKSYDVFIPVPGFAGTRAGEGWISDCLEGDGKTTPFIGLSEEPGHRGNANRFAFWADSEQEVNRIGDIVRAAGAPKIEGPVSCSEYTPGYYAVFFEDTDGNRWEICCRHVETR